MLGLFIYASLYLSGLRIEGVSLLSQSQIDSIRTVYMHKPFELKSFVDSLFKIYENTGFFNVKFDVTVDTLAENSVFVTVFVSGGRLPIIEDVRLEGLNFYRALKKTYFPFTKSVFTRKELTSSLSILKNMRMIENSTYYFINQEDNRYLLLINLIPSSELFNINLYGGKSGVSGDIAISQKSIFSTGVSLRFNAKVQNDTPYMYISDLSALIPYARGFFVDGGYYRSFSNDVPNRGCYSGIAYTREEWMAKLIYRNTVKARLLGADLYLMGPDYISSVYFSIGHGGWSAGDLSSFRKDRLCFSLEESLFLLSNESELIISLPLYSDVVFIDENVLSHAFLFRTRLNLRDNFYVLGDLMELNSSSYILGGVAYIKKNMGIYLGYVGFNNEWNLRLGFVLGRKNSLFERSIHIL